LGPVGGRIVAETFVRILKRDASSYLNVAGGYRLTDPDHWPALWPAEPKLRARARLLEHKSDEVYFPPVVRLMGLQGTPDDPAAVEARGAALAVYDAMEKGLAGKEWLAGGYSYADIAFYMAQLFGERMGAPMTDAHPALQAWRDRMSARPPVRQVAGAMGRYLLSQGRKLPTFLARLNP
jgi:glutathione S-transferase